MPVTKTAPTQIGYVANLAASASYVSNPYDVSDAIATEIEIILSYGTAPTTGTVEVGIIASQDGVNYSNNKIGYASITPSGTAYRYVIGFDVIPHKSIKVEVTNNTDQAVTATINAIKTT